MEELVLIGFRDYLRAVEVLPQLQRLKFDWSADLRNAIAVQIEKDGRLRLHYSQILDPSQGIDEAIRWKAILSAIVPLPHMPSTGNPEMALQVHQINSEGSDWLKSTSIKGTFMRDAAAILRPGNSAILSILKGAQPALPVLLGYSPIVLHVTVSQVTQGTKQL